MSSKLDLVGQKFNRMTVVALSTRVRPKRSARYWVCKCDCGTVKDVRGPELVNGSTTSCGCYNAEKSRKHGKEGTTIYSVWASMKYRCQNPKSRAYPNYGGRGITVCEAWKDFMNFYADMGDAPEGMDLDREDNEKGYTPENCRWVSRTVNMNNRRVNLNLTLNGETRTATQWARITGLSRTTIGRRVKQGWSDEDVLTLPLSRRKPTTN